MEKIHVLIVDDDKDAAEFFNVVMRMAGFECELVYSGKTALSTLARSTPDIILLDLHLGLEINGEDILYQIRSNPRFENTRVVVITGYPALTPPITGLADLILIKPVEIDQLRRLASRIADSKANTRLDFYRDPVTQLFNQELFISRLEHAFDRFKRRSDFLFALMVFTFTLHSPGGYLTTSQDLNPIYWEFAERLRHIFRPTDTLARINEKYFATLHEELKQLEDLDVLENRLREAMAAPFRLNDQTFNVVLNLGKAAINPKYQFAIDMLNTAKQAISEETEPSPDTGN
jgi:PleD family two-component response regulator